MGKVLVNENEQFEQLYQKYKSLNVKLDKANNPLVTTTIGGTLVAVSLLVGRNVMNINIPTWVIAAGYPIIGATVYLGIMDRTYRLTKMEKKLIRVANKNNTVIDFQNGHWDLENGDFFTCNEAYIEFYHNQITHKDNVPIKKMKKSK